MCNAQIVEPHHGGEHLPHDGHHQGLPLRAWAQIVCLPREEVSLCSQGRDDVSTLLVPENAQELGGVWEADPVQLPEQAEVDPRPLGRAWVLCLKLLCGGRDPFVRHLLDGNLFVVQGALHEIDVAKVPTCVL